MTRRPAALLLAAAMIVAGVVASPCAGNAACAMVAARPMDCCKGPGAGISAPRCCHGSQQVSRGATPVITEGPVQSAPPAPAMQVRSVVVAFVHSTHVFAPRRVDAGAAPPGGTLIAQHTSLLL